MIFQEFIKNNLSSFFIKSLLAQTPVCLFTPVVGNDHIVKGCYYLYKSYIIRCDRSGILKDVESSELYPSAKIFPSIFLFAKTGEYPAGFTVIALEDPSNIQTHAKYKSNSQYYDSTTHYHLGNYLRYLNATRGINLLPYYNCYNNTAFKDISLKFDSDTKNVMVSKSSSSKYKLIGVPIQFGKTYSIHIDCSETYLIRCCIYDDTALIDEDNYSEEFKETLRNSGMIVRGSKFYNSITYSIQSNDYIANMLQKNLYLVIQLPMNNTSSIVVLENYKLEKGVKCNSIDAVRQPIKNSHLSLLSFNYHKNFAFSFRLLEYLLNYTIHENSDYPELLANIQTALANCFPEYAKSLVSGKYKKGIWDSDIPRYMSKLIEDSNNYELSMDHDLYINSDFERLLSMKVNEVY